MLWARWAITRSVVAIIATAAAALLAGGCGSASGGHVAQLGSTTTNGNSSSSKTSTSSAEASALAFALCMRSHGVPGWPDPNGYGGFDKSQLTDRQLGAS